jgi:transposase
VKKYIVTLSDQERQELRQMVRRGTAAARKLSRGRILLKADEQEGWTDVAIADAFDVGVRTVERLRQRFVEQGLDACLNPITQPRTHVVALACSEPPDGYHRWTLRLLAGRMVELDYVETISHETVRQTLKKTN